MTETNQDTEQNRAPPALTSLLKLCLAAAMFAWGLTASAYTATSKANFIVDTVVPDGDTAGLTSVQTIATPHRGRNCEDAQTCSLYLDMASNVRLC